jgi:coproporphyrinogen III oxidase
MLHSGTGEFIIDDWERPEGGGGRSRVLQNGTVIEKGGVIVLNQHKYELVNRGEIRGHVEYLLKSDAA